MSRKEKIVSIEEADALGFGSLSRDEEMKYDFIPFKLPDLEDDEIRLKMLYVGLCHTDMSISNGSWGGKLVNIPCVPGHELVGEVIQAGKSVTKFKKGDKVGYGIIGKICGSCIHCIAGNTNLCKSIEDVLICVPHFGGWATHYQGKAITASKIPDGYPLDVASPLMCAGLTTFTPMKKYVKAGDHVCVVGIGGLGHIAIKFAKALGCKVTALSTSESKVEEIQELGADKVVLFDKIGDMQQSRDVDVVICCISEGQLDPFIKVLRQRGTFIMVGLPPVGKEYLKIDTHFLVFNEITIVGGNVGSVKDMEEMLEFANKHKIYPVVEMFGFDDFQKAIRRLQYEKPRFRCVVQCDSEKYPQFNK